MSKLTGQIRHRIGLNHRLVLEVEFEYRTPESGLVVKEWCSADVSDLNALGRIETQLAKELES